MAERSWGWRRGREGGGVFKDLAGGFAGGCDDAFARFWRPFGHRGV